MHRKIAVQIVRINTDNAFSLYLLIALTSKARKLNSCYVISCAHQLIKVILFQNLQYMRYMWRLIVFIDEVFNYLFYFDHLQFYV